MKYNCTFCGTVIELIENGTKYDPSHCPCCTLEGLELIDREIPLEARVADLERRFNAYVASDQEMREAHGLY